MAVTPATGLTGGRRQHAVQKPVRNPGSEVSSPDGVEEEIEPANTAPVAIAESPFVAQMVLESTNALAWQIHQDAMKRFADGVGAVVAGGVEGSLDPGAQCLGRLAFPRIKQFKTACLEEAMKAHVHVPGIRELVESLADVAAPCIGDGAGAQDSRLAEPADAVEPLQTLEARPTLIEGERTVDQQLIYIANLHKRQAARLLMENHDLLSRLSNALEQLTVVQAANKQLEAKLKQQDEQGKRQERKLELKQQELHRNQILVEKLKHQSDKQAGNVAGLQLQVHSMQQQQVRCNLQADAATAAVQKANGEALQLLATQDKDAASIAALQQKVQQLQRLTVRQQQVIEHNRAAAIASAAREAAVQSTKERIPCKTGKSK